MPEFTGERVIPGEVDTDLLNEHQARYAFARRFAEHRRVLDLGCGSGYGAALLAEVAEQVIGIDVAADAVDYARDHHAAANLVFDQGDVTAPLSQRFDLIVAFEVIEHLEDWRGLLKAARAQLNEGGLFLVSTPNRPFYAETRKDAGTNPFHVHEFDHAEFRQALTQVFPHVTVLAQNHSSGFLIAPAQRGSGVETVMADSRVELEQAHFFLGVCTLEPMVEIEGFFWVPSSTNLLGERDRHIALLSDEVDKKTRWLEDRAAELAMRNAEYEGLLQTRSKMQEELESRNRWALEQNELLRERGERVQALQLEIEETNRGFQEIAAAYEARLAELELTNQKRTEWAHRLQTEVNERAAQLAQCGELLDLAEQTVTERTLWAQQLEREGAQWQERFTTLRRSPWVRTGSRLGFVREQQASDRR